MMLFVVLLITAAGLAAQVEWKTCTLAHHNNERRYGIPYPARAEEYDVQLIDVDVHNERIAPGDHLEATVLFRVGEDSRVLNHPRVALGVSKDGMMIRSFRENMCQHVECPLQPGEEYEYEFSYHIPEFTPDGEYVVETRLKENAVNIECAYFTITVETEGK